MGRRRPGPAGAVPKSAECCSGCCGESEMRRRPVQLLLIHPPKHGAIYLISFSFFFFLLFFFLFSFFPLPFLLFSSLPLWDSLSVSIIRRF